MKHTQREKWIRSFKHLAETAPQDLWVLVADSKLYIMEKKNGRHVVTPDGGVDSSMIVDSINIDVTLMLTGRIGKGDVLYMYCITD